MIRFVTITPNNQYIVTASEDYCIGVFQIHRPVRVHIFKDVHTSKKRIFCWENANFEIDTITSIKFTHNSAYMVSSSSDKSIKIYDMKRMEIYHSFNNIHQGSDMIWRGNNNNLQRGFCVQCFLLIWTWYWLDLLIAQLEYLISKEKECVIKYMKLIKVKSLWILFLELHFRCNCGYTSEWW